MSSLDTVFWLVVNHCHRIWSLDFFHESTALTLLLRALCCSLRQAVRVASPTGEASTLF
ncbi:hypothetical protein [Nostoc sp.]|uniref:hypothetical protein n=1 Tax=Nostoc sp. TaxID=1180 RepID=UPI002FF85AB4